MTDERPAEPDIQTLMMEVDLLSSAVAGDGGAIVDVIAADLARAAVEAAARLCAIEYAESRVRAMYCRVAILYKPGERLECREKQGTTERVGRWGGMPDGGVEIVDHVFDFDTDACDRCAELAALARLKEAIR